MTYNGATVRMWLDGAVVDQGNKELDTRDRVLLLSRKVGDDTEAVDGAIDDVRIYDRLLPDAEILALYHEGGWTGP